MKTIMSLFAFLILGFILVACGSAPVATTEEAVLPIPTQPPISVQTNVEDESQALLRTDAQGAVTVAVEPSNLQNPENELIFEVSMNTHSVDLSMDLAALATLTTDTGITIQASSWDGPSGGHHVSGNLSFPAEIDGKSFLNGATKISLIIKDVDAPERIFTWDLSN